MPPAAGPQRTVCNVVIALSTVAVRGSILSGARMSIITRFAPSPTGFLHLGHAHAALVAWRRARAAGGRFLLRIEDIDATRCRPAFTPAILEDLAWLGLDWDGPVRVQSEHLPEYGAVLDGLARRGLLYPCFCSRADIQRAATAPHGPDGPVYPGTCRGLDPAERARRIAAGQPYALRLDTARALAETGALSYEAEDSAPSPAIRSGSATWCWQGGTRRPATTSASPMMTPPRA